MMRSNKSSKRSSRLTVGLAVLIVSLSGRSLSATELVTNGSFETVAAGFEPPDNGLGNFGWRQLNAPSTAITGWTIVSGSVDIMGGFWVDSDGERSVDMSGSGAGIIEQQFATAPGARIRVTFDMAGNPNGGSVIKLMEVSAAGQSEVFSFDRTGRTFSDMGWVTKTFEFTATSALTTLRFRSLENTVWGPALDNVSAELACPCDLFTATAFEDPMGKKKKLGSTLPVKFQLFFDGTEVTSQEQLDDILTAGGCAAACPEIRIFDVTENSDGTALPDDPDDNVGEGGDLGVCFRFSDGRWIYNLKLDDETFAKDSEYRVEVQVGDCVLSPGNDRFQTKSK